MMDVEDMRLLGRQALYRLVLVVERRSGDFGSHSKQTAKLVRAVGQGLGLSEAERELLAQATMFHDIGKVAVPHAILSRTGPLTREERAVVETHSEIGSWLLAGRGCPLLDLAAEIALQHHEDMDGSGYPYALKRDEIALEARIVHVCDVFDALTSDRTYRPAFTVTEALRMIVADAGSKYDPDVVDALTAVIPEWELCVAA
jgi:HD-GYP domain-containing protein (c-di-GMP phosphodiesterase class II)